jgi:hypothetical protein
MHCSKFFKKVLQCYSIFRHVSVVAITIISERSQTVLGWKQRSYKAQFVLLCIRNRIHFTVSIIVFLLFSVNNTFVISVLKFQMHSHVTATLFLFISIFVRVRSTSVGILTGLRSGQPKNRDLIPGSGRIFFFPRKCPGRLWGSPSLLSNGYRG